MPCWQAMCSLPPTLEQESSLISLKEVCRFPELFASHIGFWLCMCQSLQLHLHDQHCTSMGWAPQSLHLQHGTGSTAQKHHSPLLLAARLHMMTGAVLCSPPESGLIRALPQQHRVGFSLYRQHAASAGHTASDRRPQVQRARE